MTSDGGGGQDMAIKCTSEIWDNSCSCMLMPLILSATAVYAIVAVLGFTKMIVVRYTQLTFF